MTGTDFLIPTLCRKLQKTVFKRSSKYIYLSHENDILLHEDDLPFSHVDPLLRKKLIPSYILPNVALDFEMYLMENIIVDYSDYNDYHLRKGVASYHLQSLGHRTPT